MKVLKKSKKTGLILSACTLVTAALIILTLVKRNTNHTYEAPIPNEFSYSNKVVQIKESVRKNEGNEGGTRQEKEERGQISSNHRRITLDEVKKIISYKNDLDYVRREMDAIHSAPDFIGGSGVSLVEYWLNNQGTEKILFIVEQKEILYVKESGQGFRSQSVRLN